jgi:NAD(P)-dependent dehydrogenase (short-subunit alcohol dehydrogenase family)
MKRYLVVGASQGLGFAVCKRLHELGHEVLGISRTLPKVACAEYVMWQHELLDVSDLEKTSEWVAARYETHPNEVFDGVVFCHAKHGDKDGNQWKPSEWQSHFLVNCTSVVSMYSSLDDWGQLTDDCNTVLLGSFLQNGSSNQPAYASSKSALWAWMRSYTMAQTTSDNKAINMLWPARVDTPRNPLRELPPADPNFFRTPTEVTSEVIHLLENSLNRRGTVIDVGRS